MRLHSFQDILPFPVGGKQKQRKRKMAIKTGTRILTSQKYQEELKSFFHNKQKKQKIVRRKQAAPENEKTTGQRNVGLSRKSTKWEWN